LERRTGLRWRTDIPEFDYPQWVRQSAGSYGKRRAVQVAPARRSSGARVAAILSGSQSPAMTSDLRRYSGTGSRECCPLVLVDEPPRTSRRHTLAVARSATGAVLLSSWWSTRSQIQALDRSQLVLPMMPGLPERRTHDYLRHGITSLFAAFNAATSAKSEQPAGEVSVGVVWGG
jgi:hypothetical protein